MNVNQSPRYFRHLSGIRVNWVFQNKRMSYVKTDGSLQFSYFTLKELTEDETIVETDVTGAPLGTAEKSSAALKRVVKITKLDADWAHKILSSLLHRLKLGGNINKVDESELKKILYLLNNAEKEIG